jgi:hippurate hydrolase
MKKTLVAAASFTLIFTGSARADPVGDRIAADMPGLMAIYRDLHQHPELSRQEVRSGKILAAEARKAGFEVTEGVFATGVVAVLRNGPGPVVMIRADMDGLPVEEQTGLAFASEARGTTAAGIESGIMHACGHDTHMTTWIETARLMAANRARWSGTLVMIGQPAEEGGGGALGMISDGLMTRFPKPTYVLAIHDSADLPSGTIGVKSGFALANVDSIDITIRGVGAHGAYPQNSRDPIVLASAIVMRLQTLASRENNPLDPVVVTVGSIHGGSKHNIIPDEVKLQLTARSYGDASRKLLLDGIRRITMAEAEASAMPADRMPLVKVDERNGRATWNTPELAERTRKLLTARFGADRVLDPPPSMASEDFGDLARAAGPATQSLMLWIGGRQKAQLDAAAREGKLLPGLHSAFWAPDADKVVAAGSDALTAVAVDLMPKP